MHVFLVNYYSHVLRGLARSFSVPKNRNIKKCHSRVFLSAFFFHIMRMRKSLASVEKKFYIERYGKIRIFATKIAFLAKRDGRLAGGSQRWKIKL